ncbi:MAG: SapC family protein [Pseudomonadota bacterium]
MVKRRAVDRADKALEPDTLPLMYKSLVPLTADRHSGMYLTENRNYEFASVANAIPVTADEFTATLRTYPIVLAGSEIPTPVALVGTKVGSNDYVESDGSWSAQSYVPAYVRRYPFAFVQESVTSDRNILCADLSSIQFETSGPTERALFTEDGKTSPVLDRVMDFCKRYELAQQRTRLAMEEAVRLDLVDVSTVTISRGGKSVKVDGFRMISEEKLRKLSDGDLASLARRGLLQIFTAHHLSLANFSGMGSQL